MMKDTNDCTFLYFKPKSGKWKYEGRGMFPRDLTVDHDAIYEANNGMPGIIDDGKWLTVVVIPDEDCEAPYAFPRMIIAKEY